MVIYGFKAIICAVAWAVLLHDAFHDEFSEMPEDLQEVWRVAFAFDTLRQAILLVGGDKGGADQHRFYKRLIAVADGRFDEHLASTASKESRHGKKTR